MTEPSPPRVLFVDQSGEIGGAELSLLDLVSARRSEGDSVVLLGHGPFEGRLADAAITVEVLPLSIKVEKAAGRLRQLAAGPRVLVAAWRLAKLARKHDVIYANTQKAAVLGAIAARLARRPLIWHVRDMLDAGHFSQANRRVVIGMTNRSATRIIANSQATAQAYRDAGGSVETSVVYNGIDPAPFEAVTDNDGQALRSELGVPGHATLVGAFGRLTPWKGQHVLLQALRDPALEATHALIVGEALFTDEDRDYAARLRDEAAAPPLGGRVHWLGHRDDVPGLMRACDVIVHTSTQPEPFGRVLVEGALAGRPTVGTNAGGAAEIIRDGDNGLLTTPGDVGELVAAIDGLLTMPDEAAQLALRGRADALQRFGLATYVARVNELIAAAVAE